MVFSWIDGQKKARHVNIEPRGKERGTIGIWTVQIRSTIGVRSTQLSAGVGRTAERGGSGDIQSSGSTHGSVTEPEGLGPRSYGDIKSSFISTLGTTHGYVDEQLPSPRGKGGESLENV